MTEPSDGMIRSNRGDPLRNNDIYILKEVFFILMGAIVLLIGGLMIDWGALSNVVGIVVISAVVSIPPLVSIAIRGINGRFKLQILLILALYISTPVLQVAGIIETRPDVCPLTGVGLIYTMCVMMILGSMFSIIDCDWCDHETD